MFVTSTEKFSAVNFRISQGKLADLNYSTAAELQPCSLPSMALLPRCTGEQTCNRKKLPRKLFCRPFSCYQLTGSIFMQSNSRFSKHEAPLPKNMNHKNISSWKGSTRIIKSNCLLHAGVPKPKPQDKEHCPDTP